MNNIELQGIAELIARFRGAPEVMQDAMRQTITRLSLKLTAHVKQDKLSGQVLNVVTGRLRRSIFQKVWQSADGQTVGQVGTNVNYGVMHELGIGRGFAGNRFLPTTKAQKADIIRRTLQNHSGSLPTRSFLRTALADMRGEITQEIDNSAGDAIRRALSR